MHELGIVESAVKAAIREMESHGASRVTVLTLKIGELAAVDPEALRFAFDAVTPATALEGASLEVESVAAIAWCARCQDEFRPTGGIFCKCPQCGEFSGELRRGREIELARLELE